METIQDGGPKIVGTKQRIIAAAIQLFSDRSYDTVTTRDIAKAVRIQPASLYSHFTSKEELLTHIYNYYEERMAQACPDLDELMRLAETEPPLDVLAKTNFHFVPADQEAMDRIVLIAAVRSRTDLRSEDFLTRNIFNLPVRYTSALLRRMLELGRIEPMDIDAFTVIQSNFCFSAAFRNFSGHPVTLGEWAQANTMLFQLIKPTGK
ncbi:MAG: TetR/AcrR family transcriptional regulator [Clostridiales Family XIII bacterium]|jgi:AcrR family transcriptional regulator|nr:TetR/AcrR family transcriptional regulator [Clostridiales Family XIII bacterium]